MEMVKCHIVLVSFKYLGTNTPSRSSRKMKLDTLYCMAQFGSVVQSSSVLDETAEHIMMLATVRSTTAIFPITIHLWWCLSAKPNPHPHGVFDWTAA